jgi:hypothetical protein
VAVWATTAGARKAFPEITGTKTGRPLGCTTTSRRSSVMVPRVLPPCTIEDTAVNGPVQITVVDIGQASGACSGGLADRITGHDPGPQQQRFGLTAQDLEDRARHPRQDPLSYTVDRALPGIVSVLFRSCGDAG